MKGDFSKHSFNPKKHYHDVLLQQGRVLLDTDWNEQGHIAAYRTETGTLDVVGPAGAPMLSPGFALVPVPGAGSPPLGTGELRIGRGRFYVDGILCENDEDLLFANQPDFDSTPLPTVPGVYVFYLDVWLRHLTVAERDSIREVALGGPDTTTRTKTVWQVKYFKAPVPLGSPPALHHCLSPLPAEVTQYSTGALSARSELDIGTTDPCGLVASGGYKRLENQLYRVEVHTAGERATASFKWSRDNGSVIARWESQDAIDKNKLVVSSLGRDEILSFRTGDWVELINDTTDLLNKPGILAQLLTAEGNVIVLDPASIRYPAGVSKVEIGNTNPRIRRWDSAGDLKMNAGNAWVGLEDGVEVRFEAGTYKTGDYWTIPARTAKADVEWPFVTPQPAHGIRHHFAKLGILELKTGLVGAAAPGWYSISDCRPQFPALTELTSVFYLGGDGQNAKPGGYLVDNLTVGVANGEWPVRNARIRFSIISGGGSFDDGSTIMTTATGSDGVANSRKWKIGATGSQQVRAVLLDAAGDPMHLPVTFSAGLNLAANVGYDGGDCTSWPGKQPTNVAEALTMLCKRSQGTGGGCSVTVGDTGQFVTIKDAVAALKNEPSISICLKPQAKAHVFQGVVITGKHLIRISGNGCDVEMKDDKLQLEADTVILENLNIQTAAISGRINILAATSITTDCSFTRSYGDTANTPYIFVESLGVAKVLSVQQPVTLHWQGNRIQANFAMAFGERVRGFVVNNQVMGSTILQYTDKVVEAVWPTLTADQRKRFEDAFRNQSFYAYADVLHLRGNLLDKVSTNTVNTAYTAGGTPGNQLRGYADLYIVENVFGYNGNNFAGNIVTFSNNHFRTFAEAVDVYILAHMAVISGNMLASTSSKIDSLVDTGRKVITGNLGSVV